MRDATTIRRAQAAAAVIFILLAAVWVGAGWAANALGRNYSGDWDSVADTYRVELEPRSYANPGGPIAQSPGAQRVRLEYFLNRPVYLVTGSQGEALFDARTGDRLSPINERMAREVARLAFSGKGEIEDAALLTTPPEEFAGASPVWRVTFADHLRTRFYISPQTGAVTARRDRHWKTYRALRALHPEGDNASYRGPVFMGAVIAAMLLAVLRVYEMLARARP